jgi:hypothetical protein
VPGGAKRPGHGIEAEAGLIVVDVWVPNLVILSDPCPGQPSRTQISGMEEDDVEPGGQGARIWDRLPTPRLCLP